MAGMVIFLRYWNNPLMIMDSFYNPEDIASFTDDHGVPFGERLKRARELAGKSPHEIAHSVGLSDPAYYDLENCPGELNRNISLCELSMIASTLGLCPSSLFSDTVPKQTVSMEELSKKIRDHLVAKQISITDLEGQVGFTIEAALYNPSEILKWNIDCLRFVCSMLRVDWLLVLSDSRGASSRSSR